MDVAELDLDPFEELTEEAPPERTAFVIDGIGKADWALGCVAREERLRDELLADADKEIERWQAFKERACRSCEHETAYLRGLLEDYTRAYHDRTGKQSLLLPAGRLQLRKRAVSVVWDNEDELLPWAGERGFTRTRVELDKAALRKHILQTGELPPGAVLEAGGELVFGVVLGKERSDDRRETC